ncbi:hypothetical protein J1N35_013811 [Gossypium stocksii]|uniref:Uncharacterized protein n=1 Tax=Gossypium stocksii TaxID=47602 RepID=A0A9D4A877_9ROSI|nr:hypothetical protein J1N35_013811 [Gossypium stocksii]
MRKEKIDVSASLKQEDQSKNRKGACKNIEVKLDGMTRWMQETSLVLQEFAKMNELRTLNYPLDMFRLTPTHQDDGANLDEEGATQEYPETEDEYEAAFQPQFSTPKGSVI